MNETRDMIPPAAVIALRELVAKWEQEREDSANLVTRFLSDLDALVARVEPRGDWEFCPCGWEPMNGHDFRQHRYHCPQSPTYHQKPTDDYPARVEPPPQEHYWSATFHTGFGAKIWFDGRPMFHVIASGDDCRVSESDPKPQWLKCVEAVVDTMNRTPALAAPPSPPPQEPTSSR